MAGSKLFSFSAEKDLILLKEVLANNPFENSNWKPVAEKFKQALSSLNISFQGQPTERCVSDRMSTLMKKFKSEELSSLRASGTDEQQSERKVLLSQIVNLKEEYQQIKNEKAEEKKRSAEEDINKAKTIRKRAMEARAHEDGSSDSTGSHPKKSKPVDQILSYLKEKHENEQALKARELQLSHELHLKELTLKEKELDLRRMELEFKMRQTKNNEL